MPQGQNFYTNVFYSITFDLICNKTMFVQNGFWPIGATPPGPAPRGSHQNSECVPLVLIHRAITYDSFKVLAKKALEELGDNKKKKKRKKGSKSLIFDL